jgi:hypothetical protein
MTTCAAHWVTQLPARRWAMPGPRTLPGLSSRRGCCICIPATEVNTTEIGRKANIQVCPILVVKSDAASLLSWRAKSGVLCHQRCRCFGACSQRCRRSVLPCTPPRRADTNICYVETAGVIKVCVEKSIRRHMEMEMPVALLSLPQPSTPTLRGLASTCQSPPARTRFYVFLYIGKSWQ